MITLYTIGFTKKSAEKFFSLLQTAEIKLLVDIRLNNSSQLAGFAKGNDLEYFIKVICRAKYLHLDELAPTKELLKAYQNNEISWAGYEDTFNSILKTRKINSKFRIEDFDHACFLCTEDTPEKCHRRLVVEYFKKMNPDKDIRIIHLH